MALVLAGVAPQTPVSELDEAWQGIASLVLRVADSLEFYQHEYRSRPWLIIRDAQSESYFRCSATWRHFLSLLDGSRTVQQAWQESGLQQTDDHSRQDVVMLMANLKSSGLLQDGSEASSKPPKSSANPWLRPFAIKIRLFDPDRFLLKTMIYVKPLFSPFSLVLWLGIVFVAMLTAWMHWPALLEHGQTRFADPRNLLWYWLLYPLLKALHEFAHAYSTRLWGGAVHEMGIMLLVFFPVPYVDSSSAHKFSSRHRRILVNAAGIMVEMLLAAFALLLWVNTAPGMVHDMAFDIVIIGGLATLAFNANPLLRFDGYYILSEWLQIPNLATRSTQYLGYLVKRYALDMSAVRSPVSAIGEPKSFLSSACYWPSGRSLHRFSIRPSYNFIVCYHRLVRQGACNDCR